ncbi:hypothetical protein BD626DRAFT_504588 [Schizophyllum amplum]|uniref:DUF1348-domain-containing protein n=1 Tax=Schizophyllum amplum TaxID=97359 RepID=A0A550C724_9AGAR|nr:hypothetical protein BD626DRAFT_504588 [Auriculariopsis ampla]
MSSPSLVPPFTEETARAKVKMAQNLWNTRDPHRVAKAYTEDSIWRNRDQFFTGHDGIIDFLTKKWEKESGYVLRKELFAWTENKIAVQFWYEFYVDGPSGRQWYRCYGLEDWTFAEDGRMKKRQMSGNDVPIREDEKWYHQGWTPEEIDRVSISEKHW